MSVGAQLVACAPGDSADRLKELISRALREPVDGWAQPLMINGSTCLLSCSAAPDGGGAAIIGTIVPDELMRMLSTADHRQRAEQLAELDRRKDEFLARWRTSSGTR